MGMYPAVRCLDLAGCGWRGTSPSPLRAHCPQCGGEVEHLDADWAALDGARRATDEELNLAAQSHVIERLSEHAVDIACALARNPRLIDHVASFDDLPNFLADMSTRTVHGIIERVAASVQGRAQ